MKAQSLVIEKVRVNSALMAQSEEAVHKANDMITFYNQYVPNDFFADDEIAINNVEVVSGSDGSISQQPIGFERSFTQIDFFANNELLFKSSEHVYDFMSVLTQNLGTTNRGIMAQLFSDLQ